MKATAVLASMALNGLQMWMEHGDQKCGFNMSMYKRLYFADEKETFAFINAYWAQLPLEKQDRIYAIYASISEDFDDLVSNNVVRERLLEKVPKLLELHNVEEIEHWVRFNSGINIPTSFNETYVENVDKNTTPDKTYTRGEYISLVALSIALRTMVPIWGAYIRSIRSEVGNDFKEQSAFALILKTAVYYCKPMQKLAEYIRAQTVNAEFNASNTLNFISREDYPHWLLALVCVKRLCIGDIRSREPNAHLVSLVYNMISQRAMYGETDFSNMIRSKKADEYGPDGESKVSNLERFKTTASISLGQIGEMEYAMKDIVKASIKVCPEIDLQLLERSLETCLATVQPLRPQIVLLAWVFSPVISPRGIDYLPPAMVTSILGAVEAILWTRGHRYLALLSTAYAIIDDSVHRVAHASSRMRPTEDLTEQVDKYFPYKQMQVGKTGVVTEIQPINDTVDKMASNLGKYTWRATAHESMIQEELGTTARRIPMIPDIKGEITRLIVDIARTPK